MKLILAIVGVVVTLFVAVIAGTFIGGVVSWVVNLVFPQVHTTLNTLTGLSLDAFDQGAVLGFMAGFLRPSSSNSSK